MRLSHRRQFVALVKFRLLEILGHKCKLIDERLIYQIIAELEDEMSIDFRQFSRRVEEISGLKR
jgi:hypothetical protein